MYIYVYIIGPNLGTLPVFGSHGENEPTIYFIAFSIVATILASMYVLFIIAFPN